MKSPSDWRGVSGNGSGKTDREPRIHYLLPVADTSAQKFRDKPRQSDIERYLRAYEGQEHSTDKEEQAENTMRLPEGPASSSVANIVASADRSTSQPDTNNPGLKKEDPEERPASRQKLQEEPQTLAIPPVPSLRLNAHSNLPVPAEVKKYAPDPSLKSELVDLITRLAERLFVQKSRPADLGDLNIKLKSEALPDTYLRVKKTERGLLIELNTSSPQSLQVLTETQPQLLARLLRNPNIPPVIVTVNMVASRRRPGDRAAREDQIPIQEDSSTGKNLAPEGKGGKT